MGATIGRIAMAIMTFTNNVCVNLTDSTIAVLPPFVGNVLDPNEATAYNGASDEAIVEGLGVFVWVNTMTVPPGYACMWTAVSPEGGSMVCHAIADTEASPLIIGAKATGERR